MTQLNEVISPQIQEAFDKKYEEIGEDVWHDTGNDRIFYFGWMACEANCAKLLTEQDYKYNKQINELLKRHVDKLEVAAEFCRQYQIDSKALSVENKQLKERLQIRDNQVASKKAVIEELEIQNKQLKAQSDVDNEINLQLNLKIMELEAENTRLGGYYMKINQMYWNDEIFEVNHGEGFYTDKFVEMVVDL